MEFTNRETWTLVHGLILGTFFLLAFADARMRLANIGGRAALVSREGRYVDIELATGGAVSADPMAAIECLDLLRAIAIPEDAPILDPTRLGAPVPKPRKILGAGINYFGHAREAGFEIPDEPLLFAKLPSSVCGPNDAVVVPAGRGQVDWEAEAVIVIGRRARYVSAAEAWDYVAGLTGGQDISDREEQFRSLKQFTMGKSFDTYGPSSTKVRVTAAILPLSAIARSSRAARSPVSAPSGYEGTNSEAGSTASKRERPSSFTLVAALGRTMSSAMRRPSSSRWGPIS